VRKSITQTLYPILVYQAMATIQTFKPIRPNPFYADQLVFTRPQVESVSGDYTKAGGLKPLKTLLETGARLRPETPEGQELAYLDIKETLQTLLENDKLWHESAPGIYVYEVVHQTYRQTGIWALTSLQDYRDGRIRIHELTFADSVRRLKNYRENTGLEGSPILLTYPPVTAINRIIAETKTKQPRATLGNQKGLHRLWKIESGEVQQALIETFRNIQTVYLADGHHRIESAVQLAKEQNEKGLPVFDVISSLYMPTDQLRIQEYDRVVIPERPINKSDFFNHICKHFHVHESIGNSPVQPREPHRIGMNVAGEWYHMLAKTHTYEDKSAVDSLDAAILQDQVFAQVFGITDPQRDSRLKCAGGEKALEEIGAIFQACSGAIAFTLCPLTVNQLVNIADEGGILPPKSTWIVPKVPYGLLLHQHYSLK
jgi:uncharacterized protein (DUF1015 family)